MQSWERGSGGKSRRLPQHSRKAADSGDSTLPRIQSSTRLTTSKKSGATGEGRPEPTAERSYQDRKHLNTETFLIRSSLSDDSQGHQDSTGRTAVRNIVPSREDRVVINSSDSEESSAESTTDEDYSKTASVLQAEVRVIGNPNVGKSTFIKAASNTEDGRSLSDAISYAVDRCLCKVRFHEVGLESMDEEGSAPTTPRSAHDSPRGRRFNGTIIVWDVMDKDTLHGVPAMLQTLRTSGEPVVLVAAKCDNPPKSRSVQPDDVAQRARSIISNVQVYETALFASRAHVSATRGLLSLIVGTRQGLGADRGTRPRSDSAALAADASDPNLGPLKSSTSSLDVKASNAHPTGSADSTGSSRQQSSRGSSSQSTLVSSSHQRQLSASDHRVPSRPRQTLSPKPHSFLILDDLSSSDLDEDEKSKSDQEARIAAAQKYTPASFSELVDMLLRPVPDEDDRDFMHTFLAFYRMTASPSVLLDSILTHYDSVTENAVMPWEHDTILDRDIAVIDDWIKQYPGDFAKPSTRQKLHDFLRGIVPETGGSIDAGDSGYFSAKSTSGDEKDRAGAARQIMIALENVVEDEDTEWACADDGIPRRRRANTFLSITSTDTLDDPTPSSRVPDLVQSARSNFRYDNQIIFGGQSTVTLSAIGRTSDSTKSLTTTSSSLVNIAESAQRQASLLTPNPHHPISKDLYRAVLSHSEEAIARELTRIDWILFSAIRPRNLIRHATGPPSPSITSITHLTSHFNHLAYWVTNLILLRDKPKHRAAMLEKLMRVASKLRKLNNYNALGAFIAAVRGPAISRLNATRELVDAGVQKKFASFEVLMSTARGHWAYRFALENTEQSEHPRIPFLPLHRRDLVVAESAGKTFVGDRSSSVSQQSQSSQSQSSQSQSELHRSKPSSASLLSGTTKVTTSTTSTASSSTTITPQNATSHQSAKPPFQTTPPPQQQRPPDRQINWPKFAVMGETLSILRKAQACAYTGFAPDSASSSSSTTTTSTITGAMVKGGSDAIRSLLLDAKICKDDDLLWERSLSVEPLGVGPSEGGGGGAKAAAGEVKKRVKGGLERLKRHAEAG